LLHSAQCASPDLAKLGKDPANLAMSGFGNPHLPESKPTSHTQRNMDIFSKPG